MGDLVYGTNHPRYLWLERAVGPTVSITTIPRSTRKKRFRRKAYLVEHLAGVSAQYHLICSHIGYPPKRQKKKDVGRTIWTNLYRATVHLIASTMFRLQFSYTEISFSRHSRHDQVKVAFLRLLPLIPIPAPIWSSIGGAWTWKRLQKLGIIEEVIEADPMRHRCREFRLAEDVIEKFVKAGLGVMSGRTMNLVTRRAVTRIRRSPASDPTRHPWFMNTTAALAYKALGEARCFIHLPKMEAEIFALRRRADIDKSVKSRHAALCAEAALLSIRLEGDLRRERWLGAGMHSYQPAYRPSYPGRLHELGLGAQGCPRSVKAAAFDYPGVINYDLTSALAAALLSVVDQYNAAIDVAIKRHSRKGKKWSDLKLDATWLRRYITAPDRGSRWLAERLRVPRDDAKRILYALMFGGTRGGAVRDVLMEYHQLDDQEVKRSLRRVGMILCWKQAGGSPGLGQMLNQLDEVIRLHVLRRGPFADKSVREQALPVHVVGTRHGRHIVNAVGRRLLVLDQQGIRALRDDLEPVGDRHIRCHVLQGVEQEFVAETICRLLATPYGKDGRLLIMSQQHDGFIVWSGSLDREEVDKIVQECVREAQEASILGGNARLEIKPLG